MRSHWLLALATIVVTVAAGTTGCDKGEARSVADVRIAFGDMPNGPAPADFGGGSTSLRSDPPNDAATTLRVMSGKLTNDPVVAGRTAGYFTSADLGGHVTGIGARWTFTPRGDTPGTMALVVSQSALAPPFAVHLVITPDFWSFGVWPPGPTTGAELVDLKTEKFSERLAQGANDILEVNVVLDGDRASITLPDGKQRVIRDERIAEWAGNYATFEAYSDRGLTDSRVGFTDIWAQSLR